MGLDPVYHMDYNTAMDTLDECGIKYLTASAIDQWRDSPAVWALKAFFGFQDYRSPAFARSMALKDGLRGAFNQLGRSASEDLALRVFQMKLGEWGIAPASPGALKEHDSILSMLDGAVKEFLERGLMVRPMASGIANSHWVDDIEVPLLSVADFVFDTHQVKVVFTHRCPSAPRPRDLMGLAIDALVRSQQVAVLYVTMKKAAWYEPSPDDLAAALRDFVMEARNLQTFVHTIDSREHAMACLPLNSGHYRWTPALREKAISIITEAQESISHLLRNKTDAHAKIPLTEQTLLRIASDHGDEDL